MNFNDFVDEIKSNNWKVHGIEVYQNNQLIHSWGDTSTKYPIYSATKTILSIALGIANDRKLIDFEKSILNYLPESAVLKLNQSQKDIFQEISLHRLMTMSVKGFPFRPSGNNYLDFSLSRNISNPQNIEFEYSNIPAYLAGVALSEAIKKDAGAFIKTEIFEPLKILNAETGYSPEGYFYGASNMFQKQPPFYSKTAKAVMDISSGNMEMDLPSAENGNRNVISFRKKIS